MANKDFKSFFIDHPNHPSLLVVFNQYDRSSQPIRQNGFSIRIPLPKQLRQRALAILNHKGSDSSRVNVAVTEPVLSKITSCNWIIDSGTTDHISSSQDSLLHKNKYCSLLSVLLPSGEKANIVVNGSLPLTSEYYLHDVLCVPTFVERKHCHILQVARTLKFHAHLPNQFFGECALHAVHIINRLPTPALSLKTPFERLYSTPALLPSTTHSLLLLPPHLTTSPHHLRHHNRRLLLYEPILVAQNPHLCQNPHIPIQSCHVQYFLIHHILRRRHHHPTRLRFIRLSLRSPNPIQLCLRSPNLTSLCLSPFMNPLPFVVPAARLFHRRSFKITSAPLFAQTNLLLSCQVRQKVHVILWLTMSLIIVILLRIRNLLPILALMLNPNLILRLLIIPNGSEQCNLNCRHFKTMVRGILHPFRPAKFPSVVDGFAR